MYNKTVKIVVFVPETHGDKVRTALAETGAGLIGIAIDVYPLLRNPHDITYNKNK